MCETLNNIVKAYPGISGAIIHNDRGSEDICQKYQDEIRRYGIQQGINSAGGRRYDNARCENM